MTPLLLAMSALGRFTPTPESRTRPYDRDCRADGKVGVIPAPLPDAMPVYDGGHRTTPAPKGKRLTRAQRKALKVRGGR